MVENRSQNPRRRLLVLVVVLFLVLIGLSTFFVWRNFLSPATTDENRKTIRAKEITFPPPPLSASRFLNAASDVKFVGAKKCAECHKSEYQSYLRTTHSRSLNEMDLSGAPPPGVFFHEISGRHYRVELKRGQMWHQESIKKGDKEIFLSQFPMRFLFGSGAHTRSYVFETGDGFLVESPITWYPSQKKWGISPGYDLKDHLSFTRVTGFRCVLCHAGRVETIEQSPDRLRIHSRAIDCERCHGPGELHVARHSPNAKWFGRADLTIVHPGRLTRSKNEAICGQCHLGNAVAVDVRGRSIGDFRPGRPLTDFRIDYDFKSPEKGMTVVGHFRQMQQSRCYQGSKTLTCTSCHHPHRKPAPEKQIAYYRNKCLSCHGEGQTGCALEEIRRLQRQPGDSCIACHMPPGDTNVPHTTFTHHRIGIHAEDQKSKTKKPRELGTLIPVGDISHLSQIDQDRCFGLAYLELSHDYEHRKHAGVYAQRGSELLFKVYGQGLREPRLDVALASLHWRKEPQKTIQFAAAALNFKDIRPAARTEALFLLSTTYFDLKDYDAAHRYLRELVRSRRDAEDWALLGICRGKSGDAAGAVQAIRQAVEINPARFDLRELLAEAFRRVGDTDGEMRERRVAAALRE